MFQSLSCPILENTKSIEWLLRQKYDNPVLGHESFTKLYSYIYET